MSVLHQQVNTLVYIQLIILQQPTSAMFKWVQQKWQDFASQKNLWVEK